MRGLISKSATFLSVLVPLVAAAMPLAAQSEPTRVVLFIGDGAGASYWTAARFAADKLAVDAFPVMGLVDTRSSDSKVTDSAAGATAFAAGLRTYNGAVGVAPDTTPVETVLEVAARSGMATGLVATSRITHATPAAFAAHVPDRNFEFEIAAQYLEQDLTVLLGGGLAVFLKEHRPDSVDLTTGLRDRYTMIQTADQLTALDADTVDALFGLFTLSHMPGAIQPVVDTTAVERADTTVTRVDTTWVAARSPTLPQMTEAALAVLDRDPEGFFVMIEGAQPDWRGHGNEPLETVTAEMLDFDRAVGVALEYQQRHPETLIVVVADHETGGLALQLENDRLVARYTTVAHTAQLVPLFARGPGAEAFAGMRANDEIGRLLLEVVGGSPGADGR